MVRLLKFWIISISQVTNRLSIDYQLILSNIEIFKIDCLSHYTIHVIYIKNLQISDTVPIRIIFHANSHVHVSVTNRVAFDVFAVLFRFEFVFRIKQWKWSRKTASFVVVFFFNQISILRSNFYTNFNNPEQLTDHNSTD